jgi:hypothetical protein
MQECAFLLVIVLHFLQLEVASLSSFVCVTVLLAQGTFATSRCFVNETRISWEQEWQTMAFLCESRLVLGARNISCS